MKIQVRAGVFETNSSSTHSLSVYENSDWEKFKKGEMVIENSADDPQLVKVSDETKELTFNPNNEDEDNDIYDYDYLTYEVWNNIWDYMDEGWETIEKNIGNKHVVSYFKQG